jgi:hypothetical protein
VNRTDVVGALISIRRARRAWDTARAKFLSDVDAAMMRLIHEAAANYMSAEEVARYSGFTVRAVRLKMRQNELTGRGKRLLARQAAKALEENAALLGIEPREMDLMSPLAYLPAGKDLRMSAAANGTGAIPDEFLETPALVHGINYFDDEVACGHLAYNDPVLITSDLDKITCEDCRKVLVKA